MQKKVAPDGSQSAGGSSMNGNKMMRYEFKIDMATENLNKKRNAPGEVQPPGQEVGCID